MGDKGLETVFEGLPHLHFSHNAEKDFKHLLRRNKKEFRQVAEDVRRLALGTLPPAGRKKLKTFDAWQMDSGRYRVIYDVIGGRTVIFAVFSKPKQKNRLKHYQ